MKSGWHDEAGKSYYLGSAGDGAMKTGKFSAPDRNDGNRTKNFLAKPSGELWKNADTTINGVRYRTDNNGRIPLSVQAQGRGIMRNITRFSAPCIDIERNMRYYVIVERENGGKAVILWRQLQI